MFPIHRNKPKTRTPARGGMALLFTLFFVAIVSLLVVNVLDSTTLELSALRNGMDRERALYLANAGVHHAAAMLEANSTWRGTVAEGVYPADDSYTATAVDGANYTAVVTSSGAAGEVTRTVQAIIEL